MRYLGLDLGDRAVGVAISDETGLVARPLTVLRRVADPAPDGDEWQGAISRIRQMVGEYGVAEVIVGLPRNMDGSLGPRATAAVEFGRKLEQALGLPVRLWDERLSTRAAERVLLAADVTRAGRRKVIDKVAAAVILQGYLDWCRERGHDAPV